MGKSRIIATVIAIKKEYERTTDFTIVFTTELLKSAVEKEYKLLECALTIEIKLVVFDKQMPLESQVSINSYTLIDEADQVLLDASESLANVD